MPANHPDRQEILNLGNAFRPACIVGAAAELDLWTVLGERSLSAQELAGEMGANVRALTMLLDALAALQLLEKSGGRYAVPPELRGWLCAAAPQTVLPMLHHVMNVMRGWSQLAWVVRAGIPGPRQSSIRGPLVDRAMFIAAMHAVSGPMADELVARLGPSQFTHLLDVGGGSGTWTLAFLRAAPTAKATIFDLPDAIGQARERLAGSALAQRVALVPGDFYSDDLPGGADFAWVSAIAHQHSRQHNRELFAKVHAALVPGGRIAIRDVVMESSRTQPLEGALFAITMLVNTDSGSTFTFDEFAEDLQAAGFADAVLRVKDERMNSVVEALKP